MAYAPVKVFIAMLNRIQKIDDAVLNGVVKLHRPLLNKIFGIFTHLGNAGIIWFAIAIPFLFTTLGRIVGINMIIGLSLTHVIGEILIKHIVCRERPCHKLDDDAQIINRPKDYSFPSGHTAASFCMVAISIARCSWYICLPVTLLALAMGFSRVFLRVHYLSDVLCGALIGIISGRLSVSVVDYTYYDLTVIIMKNHTVPYVDPVNGMPMSSAHILTEIIVWLVIAVIGVSLLIFFHRRGK